MSKYELPDEVRRETEKCPHDFSCLTTGQCGDRPLCGVEYADGKNLLFLTETAHRDCPYGFWYGGLRICTCPTHFHLFRNHLPSQRLT